MFSAIDIAQRND